LGYFFLNRKQTREAIEVFKFIVELYPEFSNVYDSLGEAYMTAQNKELAIKNYEKALELDPETQTAIDALKKLKGINKE